jgi:carbon monoxide dehydrogenase subunit G
MKVEGQYKIPASREKIYSKLLDPQVLSKVLPGVKEFEPDGDDRYRAKMQIGIGPVKGTYDGHVQILDKQPPESYRIKVDGKGPGGNVNGEAILSLDEQDGETTINYSGDAQVGGTLASVGQRMVHAASKHIIDQFFDEFKKQAQSS